MPISTDLAVRRADLLKAASSPTSMSLATSFPENIDKLREPSFTGRANSALALDSRVGRNLFTSIRNGNAIVASRAATTAALTTNIQRFLLDESRASMLGLRGPIL